MTTPPIAWGPVLAAVFPTGAAPIGVAPGGVIVSAGSPQTTPSCPYTFGGPTSLFIALTPAQPDGGVTAGQYEVGPVTASGQPTRPAWAVSSNPGATSVSGSVTLTSVEPFAGSFDITFDTDVARDAGTQLRGSFTASRCP